MIRVIIEGSELKVRIESSHDVYAKIVQYRDDEIYIIKNTSFINKENEKTKVYINTFIKKDEHKNKFLKEIIKTIFMNFKIQIKNIIIQSIFLKLQSKSKNINNIVQAIIKFLKQ